MSTGAELVDGALRAASSAKAGPRVVAMRREPIPMDLLLVREDPSKFPRGVVQTREQLKEKRGAVKWASQREHLFAACAAGMHLACFAFNVAFWGFEGMPPDRYWPNSIRMRMGIRSGRYGNLEGAQRIFMDNLARVEGVRD